MARKRKEGCCNIELLKYILFIFNFFFWLTGAAILAVGVWTVLAKSHYMSLLSTASFAVTSYLLLAAGALVIIVGTVGCVGIWKEKRSCLLAYTILLVVIFLVEAVAGVLAYIYQMQLQSELDRSLRSTFMNGYKQNDDVTAAIDSLQQAFECCGARDYDDWKSSVWTRSEGHNPNNTVPDSCCITVSENCGQFLPYNHPSNIWDTGCIGSIEKEVRYHTIILAAVGLAFALMQIFGILFACCLWGQLKEDMPYQLTNTQPS